MCCFMLFVGLVLYIILAMSDPFQGMLDTRPVSLEYVLESLQGHSG
ncbi:MAG: hypothetical protein JSV80_08085 [Acidobacteriota bacterium]|nr:MAG: hypothetical protein JSV80_08085 [Acidobacteriota bacterium]